MHSISTSYPLGADDSMLVPATVERPTRSNRESKSRLDIRPMQDGDRAGWDRFSASNQLSSLYQLAAWKDVIARSYAHQTQYIVARQSTVRDPLGSAKRATTSASERQPHAPGDDVVGVLPMAHVQHWLFG